MNRELIIEKYGQGNAVVVLEDRKIVDLFIDPPFTANFYPPDTFVEAKIQRRVSKRGGYFVKLPNGNEGFLKSRINYNEGDEVVILSKVFFDEDKPQTFTDKLKIVSKYFILKSGDSGFSFSRKTSKTFCKDTLIPILKEKIKDQVGIFLICRSQVADISIRQIIKELDKIIKRHKSMMKALLLEKKYYGGQAKSSALDKYNVEEYLVIEKEYLND